MVTLWLAVGAVLGFIIVHAGLRWMVRRLEEGLLRDGLLHGEIRLDHPRERR